MGKHVVIIGAGVVGVTAAWRLARNGREVTVLERNSGAGLETSNANVSQLSWESYTAPLAAPPLLRMMPGVLLDRHPDLRIMGYGDPAFWPWAMRLVWNSLPFNSRRHGAALQPLLKDSHDGMLEFIRECPGVDFDYRDNGKLYLYATDAALQKARAAIAGKVLTTEACIESEPSLEHARDMIAGGIFSPGDAAGDCHAYTANLADYLGKQGMAEFRYGAAVDEILVSGGRVAGVRCGEEEIAADAVVVCAANGAAALLKPHGVNPGISPAKGYTLVLPRRDGVEYPVTNITMTVPRLVFAPLEDTVRVSGRMHFGAKDATPDPDVVAELTKAASSVMPQLNYDEAEVVCGLRPCTPTGLPLIGPAGYENLYLNTGHGTYGWTLAQGSAVRLAEMIGGA